MIEKMITKIAQIFSGAKVWVDSLMLGKKQETKVKKKKTKKKGMSGKVIRVVKKRVQKKKAW